MQNRGPERAVGIANDFTKAEPLPLGRQLASQFARMKIDHHLPGDASARRYLPGAVSIRSVAKSSAA